MLLPEAPPLSAALKDTPAGIAPDLIERTAHGGSETTSGTPRESLDVPEDLPKQAPRQVTLGQLEDVILYFQLSCH